VSDGAIQVNLDRLLAERGMTLVQLSDLVGVSAVNLSLLKNGHAKAIRFSTLSALCAALCCQPGDLLRYRGGPDMRTEAPGHGNLSARCGPLPGDD
jgi:putative transcriptional regulator